MLKFIVLFIIINMKASFAWTSYAEMIPQLDINESCKVALTDHYSRGENLASDIIKRQLIALTDYNQRAGVFGLKKIEGYTFYHYTNASLSTFNANEILVYLKKKSLKNIDNWLAKSVFYIANDPRSSKSFGPRLLRIKLRPESKILPFQNYMTLDWIDIKNHLIQTTNLVNECEFEDLKPMILEDSGTEIVDYYSGGNHKWLMLLNSKPIEKLDFIKNVKWLRFKSHF